MGVAFFVKKKSKLQYQELKIPLFFPHVAQFYVSLINSNLSPKLDLSIEGMESQQFSEGVFVFLMLGIALFSGIIFVFGFSKGRLKGARIGEWVIFGAIILGVVAAVIMAAMQMLGGFLF